MMGWHCTLYRDYRKTIELAQWQCGVQGLEWLDPHLQEGRARLLQEGGYPAVYLVRAEAVLPLLQMEPPDANALWDVGSQVRVDRSRWKGRTTIDHEALAKCDPSEWLLLEAWDES